MQAGSGEDDVLWSKAFTMRIENFSQLGSEPVWSECFEAGIGTRRLQSARMLSGVPCDMTLQLPCGANIPVLSQFLQVASHFFRENVDGSLGTWTYILSDLYPQYDPPALTLSSVYTLLPVVHKYDFTKLRARLVAFIKDESETLSFLPQNPVTYIIAWLALAERLQLGELRELCLGKLGSMTGAQLLIAITVDVEAERVVRQEVKQMGLDMCCALLSITVRAS
ncbi:hypothetical protein FOA52_015077 [Chlamydomonas sp. UWO 241]|nr:hypothetical protein FOA52_015077 [Chlamydomonas sp. UWO 241]